MPIYTIESKAGIVEQTLPPFDIRIADTPPLLLSFSS